jgi:hypothetical protein
VRSLHGGESAAVQARGPVAVPLQPDADPVTLASSIVAALQGGLLLTQTTQSLKPREAALDGALRRGMHAGTLGQARPTLDAGGAAGMAG